MSNVGYATLTIIPTTKGFAKSLTGQVGQANSAVASSGGGLFKSTGDLLAKSFVGGFALQAGQKVFDGIASTAGAAVSGGFARALNIQDAQAKLKGLGNSTADVDKIMSNALESVKGTAFGLGDAAGVAAGAVAAGIKPGQDLARVLKLTADSATIAGTDLGSMGSIFNKVAASGKLQGDVIAQLQDAGVPVLQFVSKQIGKTAAETSKMASAGQIDFKTFSDAMEAGLGGAALTSGNTARGALANVKAALGRFGATFATPIVAAAPAFFNTLSGAIDAVGSVVKPFSEKFGSGVSAGLTKASGSITAFVSKAPKAISDFYDGFSKGVDEINSNQSALAHWGAAFYGALAPAGAAVKEVFGQIASAIGPFLAPIKDAVLGLLPTFLNLAGSVSPFQIVLKALAPVLPQIANLLGSVVSSVLAALGPALKTVVPLVAQLSDTISSTLAAALPVLLPLIGQLASAFVSLVPVAGQILAAILPLATTLVSQLAPIFLQLVSTVLPPLVEIFSTLAPAIAPLVSMIAGLVIPVVKALLPVVSAVFGALVPIISAALQIVLGVVKVVTGLLTGNWKMVWSGLKGIFVGAFNLVVAAVKGAFSVLGAAIGAGLKAAGSLFAGLGGLVLKSIGNLGSLLLGVGKDIVAGLGRGISGAWGAVMSAVHSLIEKIPAAVRKILDIHSPSRVMAELGRYVTQGFAVGITGSQPQVAKAMQTLSNKVLDAFASQKLVKAASKGSKAVYTSVITAAQEKSALSLISQTNGKLQALAKQRTLVAARLKVATKAYQDALKVKADYASSISNAVLGTVDASKTYDLVGNLTDQIEKTKELTSTLAQLKKLGLDSVTYKQLADGGLDSLGPAEALLESGKSGISQVASLQKELTKAATGLGSTVSNDLYGAGVNAAKGLVNGLQSQSKQISAQMTKIASSMVSSIKKALGIHSPSRVMFGLGGYTGEGFALGLEDQAGRIDDASSVLSPTLPNFRSPDVAVGGIQGALAATRSTEGAPIIQNIHPTPGMSEETVAELAARKLLRAGAGR